MAQQVTRRTNCRNDCLCKFLPSMTQSLRLISILIYPSDTLGPNGVATLTQLLARMQPRFRVLSMVISKIEMYTMRSHYRNSEWYLPAGRILNPGSRDFSNLSWIILQEGTLSSWVHLQPMYHMGSTGLYEASKSLGFHHEEDVPSHRIASMQQTIFSKAFHCNSVPWNIGSCNGWPIITF